MPEQKEEATQQASALTLKAPPSKRAKTSTGTTANDNNNDNDDDAMSVDDDDDDDKYQLLPGFGEHKRAVSSVKFAPPRLTKRSALCASSAADGVVKLYDVQDCFRNNSNDDDDDNNNSTDTSSFLLEPQVTCTGHSRGINEICWNPVSPLLASASDDKTVRLWDAVTGDTLVEYRGHDNFVFCVDQHEHMVVSGSFDETVKIWDIRSGDCVSTLPAHSDPVTSVSFSRDGTVVCSASHDGLIRLWDVPTGECLKTIYAAGNPPVCTAKFSPNAKYILAGTLMDATLRLWPVHRTGSNLCAKSYRNPQHFTNSKYSIAADFMHDGNIVTGSESGELVIYDLQSAQTLQVLSSAHQDAVLAVSAHDAYPLLASGSMTADRKVYFWAPKGYKLPETMTKTSDDNNDKSGSTTVTAASKKD